MTAFGKVIKGRGRGVRCDGCGRISTSPDGYYFDRERNAGGTISSQGRECDHDYCKECEAEHQPPNHACRQCGAIPGDIQSERAREKANDAR